MEQSNGRRMFRRDEVLRACTSFPEGCCGCCVNLRWSRGRLLRWLQGNTREARQAASVGASLSVGKLIRWHWRRGGFWDHLLGCWLVGPTLGLSAWVWKRWFGSCAFAGFVSENPPRVGCLVHPAVTAGSRDWRRWAFPLVPTLRCDRGLLCGLLFEPPSAEEAGWDWVEASRAAGATRRRGVSGRH